MCLCTSMWGSERTGTRRIKRAKKTAPLLLVKRAVYVERGCRRGDLNPHVRSDTAP